MISCQSFLISLITSLSFVFTESISNEYNFQDNSTDMTSRELIHDDDVTKIFNDYEITRDMVVTGDLKIVGGMLVVNGTVNGEIQVLGGDIEINESAIVNGTIIAIGGTIRKSPLATIKGEILELNKDKFSISRIPDDETGAEFSDWFKEDNCCSNCCVNDIKRPHSKPYSDDDWMRYNRAEGFYLQLNFHVENEFIPGNTFYGGIGRSFHRNKYSGIIGFEQRLFRDSFQLYIEKYDRSSTDDTWRMNGRLNSLSAFFIHEDFLDWYHTDGFEAGGFLVFPRNIKIFASYKDELQSSMNTVATWSLFGSNKLFREGYLIDDGKEVSLKYGVSVGKKYKWGTSSKLSAFFQYSTTKSQDRSDFIFEKHDFSTDSYFPVAHELGIHASVDAGTISGEYFGLQHYYQIGGIGSLRGYEWKLFNGTQYSLGTLELVFGNMAVFYDRAAVWSDEINKISSDHWDKLINSYNGESVGLSFGSHKTRIDIIKPLGGDNDNDIQINFLLFLNDGGC